MYLPREFLVRIMPLQHLPIYTRARKDVNAVVVFGMSLPQLWCLPVHCANETSNHRSRGLFDFGQPEVGDFSRALRSDEDIRRLAVPMNDGGLAFVEVMKTTCDVQHYGQLHLMSADMTETYVENQS